MKRLLISGFAAIAVVAAATSMLRSHSASADHPVIAADMTSRQAASGVNKLPIEEFEDMSLVYSTAPKH
jgi:hypothetical protein